MIYRERCKLISFWQDRLLPVFFRGKAEFLFKGPVKAGVIRKAVLMVQLPKRDAGEDSVFTGLKPFFQDVLVKGNPHIILKYMGNVIFAGIKKRRPDDPGTDFLPNGC